MDKPRLRMSAVLNKSEPEYHGASTARRFAGYGVSGTGPNAALTGSLETLRNRSRHSFRNSPLVKKAIRANVTNAVGIGIMPSFVSEDQTYNEAMHLAWKEFAKRCDPEGILGIYGITALVDLTRRMQGECFIRRRRRSLGYDGLKIPLQLQVLEPDFVPVSENKERSNGNRIKNGIEFNRRGKRVAYWMYREHPGEQNQIVNASQLVRVRAEDVIHVFRPERPGQIRGEPETATSLLKVKTFDSYDDAELQRKEVRSGYTGMLTRQEFDDNDYLFNPFTGESLTDEGAPEEASIQPGTFITGLPGEDLKLFDGDNTGSGYKDFVREQKLMIAAGLNIPIELMSGDWSAINDRIYRALIQEYRRGIEMDQQHILIFQALEKIAGWVIEASILAGVIRPLGYAEKRSDYHKIEWRPQAWKYINPVQDIQAQVMAKDNHLASGDALVEESGHDAAEVDKQNVQAELRRKELREEAGLAAMEEDDEGSPDDLEDEDDQEPDEPGPDEDKQ